MHNDSAPFEATTNSVRVEVWPKYLGEQYISEANHHVFSYTIRVTNLARVAYQLRSRQWLITDGTGRTEMIEGPGVVGQQPWIEPDRDFEYTSFCPLPTPTGSMRGHYVLVDHGGKEISIKIPAFILAEPRHYH